MKINKPTQDSQTILQSIYPNQSRLSTCSALYFLKPTTKKGTNLKKKQQYSLKHRHIPALEFTSLILPWFEGSWLIRA